MTAPCWLDDRFEYLMIAAAAEATADGTLHVGDGHVAGAAVRSLPAETAYAIVGRIHWRAEDMGKVHEAAAGFVQPDGGLDIAQASASTMTPVSGGPNVETGRMPTLMILRVPVTITQPGRHAFRVMLDGAPVGELPFEVTQALSPARVAGMTPAHGGAAAVVLDLRQDVAP